MRQMARNPASIVTPVRHGVEPLAVFGAGLFELCQWRSGGADHWRWKPAVI